MTTPSMNSVLHAILSSDPAMPADDVIRAAKARGLRNPDTAIRNNIYNVRSALKKQAGKAAPKSAPATKPAPVVTPASAARLTVPPKSSPPNAGNVTPAATRAVTQPAVDLAGVFSTVTLVNEVVAVCGGIEPARQVAEAVRVCGSVDAFLQHLDLLAGLRASVVSPTLG